MNSILSISILFFGLNLFAAPFPQNFIGTWDGPCTSASMNFNLKLSVLPTSDKNRFTWTLNYTSDTGPQVTRNYFIELDSKNSQLSWLDEGAGAKFVQLSSENEITNLIQNQSVLLHSKYIIENKILKHEIYTYGSKMIKVANQVGSFSPASPQKCTLKKVN
jgi:hypothetical protein